jgi:phosphate transport system protein
MLKEAVLSFGKTVELIFRDSMIAVIDLDVEMAEKILAFEAKMDEFEEEIEVSILDLLALQQPIASDLRLIVSALKISADLKRIMGLSINIAKITGKIEDGHIKPLVNSKKMTDIAAYMLENSLKAFEMRDQELARATAAKDDEVDKLLCTIWSELIEMMTKDRNTISISTYRFLMIRNIERIADHCCNICESVVYLVTSEHVKLN